MTTVMVEKDTQVNQETRRILKRFARKRDNLIPILQEVQNRLGYLPREAMLEVADDRICSMAVELAAARNERDALGKRAEELEGWRDKMRDRYDALALVLEKIASERGAAREGCLYAIGCIDGTIRDYADKLPKLLRAALAGADKGEK